MFSFSLAISGEYCITTFVMLLQWYRSTKFSCYDIVSKKILHNSLGRIDKMLSGFVLQIHRTDFSVFVREIRASYSIDISSVYYSWSLVRHTCSQALNSYCVGRRIWDVCIASYTLRTCFFMICWYCPPWRLLVNLNLINFESCRGIIILIFTRILLRRLFGLLVWTIFWLVFNLSWYSF